jgi:hypothetical protein
LRGLLQGLALLACNLAALRLQPPGRWMQRFMEAAVQQDAAATPAGCFCLAFALGTWGAVVPVALQASLRSCLAVAAQRVSDSGATSSSHSSNAFRPQQLALTLWGVGRTRTSVAASVVLPLLQVRYDCQLRTGGARSQTPAC